MTTGAAKPAGEDRHRLTVLEGLAALSLHAALPVVYGPKAAPLTARQLGAGS